MCENWVMLIFYSIKKLPVWNYGIVALTKVFRHDIDAY